MCFPTDGKRQETKIAFPPYAGSDVKPVGAEELFI